MATKKYLDLTGLQHFKGLLDVRYPVLGADNLIPAAYLPSYVDDVVEVADYASLPKEEDDVKPESGKIYVTLDTNLTYRWSGTQYVEISKSLALGETSSTAYAGDKGLANANAIHDLQSALQTEQTARERGDENLQTQITNITTGDGSLGARLTAAEGAIAQEVTDRSQAVSDLNTRVDAIVEVNDDHDTRIKANLAAINKEVSDRTDAVSALDAAYKAADAAQTTAITTAYEAADTALDGKISDETATRTSEITRVEGLITSLDGNIGSITNTEIDGLFA